MTASVLNQDPNNSVVLNFYASDLANELVEKYGCYGRLKMVTIRLVPESEKQELLHSRTTGAERVNPLTAPARKFSRMRSARIHACKQLI